MTERAQVIRIERTPTGFVSSEPLEAVEAPVRDRLMPLLRATITPESGTVTIRGRPVLSDEIYWDEDEAGGYAVILPSIEEGGPNLAASARELANAVRRIWKRVARSESLTEDSAISVATDFLEPGLRCIDAAGERSMPWYEMHSTRRLMVLGEPGSGKSTLLRRMILDLLDDRSRLGPELPVFARLRDFHERAVDLPALTEQAGERDWGDVARAVEQGRVLLVLDGLDEATEQRQSSMVKEIKALCDRFPQIKVVVSCRSASYVEPLEGFRTVAIEPFDDDRVAQWSNRYFRRRGAEHLWHQFVDAVQSEETTRDLCGNPLLLNLTARLYESSAVLPTSRTELLGRCLSTMTHEWDEVRGVRRFNRGEVWQADIQDALHKVALQWLADPSMPIDYPVSWAAQGEADRGGTLTLHTVARSCGVLDPVGDAYRFSHSSFREYLAALALTRAITPPRDVLRERLAEEAWRRVWLVACGLVTDASELCVDVLNHADLALPLRLRLLARALAQGSAISADGEHRVAVFLSDELIANVWQVTARQLSVDEAEARRTEIRPLDRSDLERWSRVTVRSREGWDLPAVLVTLHRAVSSGHGTALIRALEERIEHVAGSLVGLLQADRLLPTPEHHEGVVDLWVQGMSQHAGVAPDVPSDADAAEGTIRK